MRFNADGPAGLNNREPPGCRPVLSARQRRAVAGIGEAGLMLAVHSVAHWRLTYLARWVCDEFALSISK